MIIKLSQLQPGETATVHSFSNSDIFLKLMEMGCIPGEKIRLDLTAPFGDPISLQVAGYQLSLRLNEAEHIFVETE
ncbi:MAG TPA: FeoA family protein [Phnomibacter sp.]|nr:FeoA family protein [Phnomibacter sp.]